MNLKNYLRAILNYLHIDISKNLFYDRLTQQIIKISVKPESTCVDIGCHKGEIFSQILKKSPKGGHYAFEPIPELYKSLKEKYGNTNHVFSFALSDSIGETSFQYVKNAPAYSGILKRKYAISNPDIEEITVKTITLDEIIGEKQKIDFIKIDVEGAEFKVLNGAKKIIAKYRPIIIFEFGKGASEFYNTTPEEIYNFFDDLKMNIYTLKGWLKKDKALSVLKLKEIYETNSEYYFLACPK